MVASDTRIPAEMMDRSEYLFGLPAGSTSPVTVRTRVLYRRTFRTWGRLDQIKPGDLELANSSTSVVW